MPKLNIDDIRIDGGTQMRVSINQDVVSDYREKMDAGDEFPPVIVYHDGSDYWLADGFHRYFSARAKNAKKIDADVRKGTQRDAILHAVGANGTHGLLRTNADKRRSVAIMLDDPEWTKWSDRQIAKACGVTHPYVASIRTPKKEKASRPDPRKVVTVTTPAPSLTPNDNDIPDDPIEPEPVAPPSPADPRETYNAAVNSAIAHIEFDAKALAIAAGAEKGMQGNRKLTNPAVAKLVTWTGTVGLLRETAEGLKGNLIVPHPTNVGEYITAVAAHRLKAVTAK
jgi:hypothetical protein